MEAVSTTVVVSQKPDHKVALEVTGREGKSLLGIVETLSKAQPPSNQQIDFLIEEIKRGLDEYERSTELSGADRRLVENLRNLFEDLQKFVGEKNKGDRLQKIINLGVETAREARESMPSRPEMRGKLRRAFGRQRLETMRNEVMEMLQAMKNLSIQILYSGDFRVLLLDSLDLILGILHNVSEEKIKPTIKEATTEEHIPTEEKAEAHGTEETLGTVGTEKEGKKEERELKERIQPEREREGSGRPGAQKKRYRKGRRGEEKGAEVQHAFERTTERARVETRSFMSELASGKYTPDEQKQMVKEKFRDILTRLGQNPDYRKAIRNLFDIFGHLGNIASDVAEQIKEKTEKERFPLHDRIIEMWHEIKSMVEEFSHKSLDPLVEDVQDFYYMVKEDEEVSEYLTDFKIFVLSAVEHPEVMKRKNFKHGEEIIDRGREIFTKEKYRGKFRDIISELREHLDGISQDTTTQVLAEDVRILFRDLLLDEEGKFSIASFKHSFGQLASLIIPLVLKQVEHIPVPKIIGETPKYQYSVDNLVFDGKEIIPDIFSYSVVSKGNIRLKEVRAEKGKTNLKFAFKDMNTYLENVYFWFKRKKSPQYEDHGTMDIDISGASLEIELIAETVEKENLPWRFTAARVECDLGHLTIYVKEAKHSFIDKVSSKLFITPVKNTMEEKIENALLDMITSFCTRVNKTITTASKKAQRAMGRAHSGYVAFRPVIESA